jgi:hypothetical protein
LTSGRAHAKAARAAKAAASFKLRPPRPGPGAAKLPVPMAGRPAAAGSRPMLPKAAKGRRQLPMPTRNAAKAAAQGPAASGRLPKGVERGHQLAHVGRLRLPRTRIRRCRVMSGVRRGKSRQVACAALHFHSLVPALQPKAVCLIGTLMKRADSCQSRSGFRSLGLRRARVGHMRAGWTSALPRLDPAPVTTSKLPRLDPAPETPSMAAPAIDASISDFPPPSMLGWVGSGE